MRQSKLSTLMQTLVLKPLKEFLDAYDPTLAEKIEDKRYIKAAQINGTQRTIL